MFVFTGPCIWRLQLSLVGSIFSIFSRVNHFRINKKPSQKREEWDKHGKYKYIIHRINEVHRDFKAVQVTLWYMIKGLEHEFMFDREYIEDLVCADEIDRDILEILNSAGKYCILPRDISHQLEIRKMTPWKITQRIRRINKQLDRLIGQKAAEKHGMQWALTSFIREAWGSAKEDLLEKAEDLMRS